MLEDIKTWEVARACEEVQTESGAANLLTGVADCVFINQKCN